MVQGKADSYRPFYEQGILRADVLRVHGGNTQKAYPPLQDYYGSILNDFLSEYDDQKVHRKGTVVAINKSAR